MSKAQPKPIRLPAITADPLWYKDAVIYQLHVKSFYDGNGDGVGDFGGLVSKLDYIKELGANTLWLLPFYPSPRRDDGYDVSAYRDVHPDYGTLADFRYFLREAHSRGLRVIADFVANHTSDQHFWFQRAQRAKPGSRWRNFYVWSDTDQKYAGTPIIFRDAERSNWTWDPVAGAYYWHRFYSHQPDLNYDEPLVVEAILRTMRFWLQLGVDGLRLGAVPYLVEREGTTNENLPETHQILRRFRAELERYFPDHVLLAEVNKWPEEVKDYFGEGDECQMAFHFPLMPRMYLAIAREDRFPLTDIFRQTPPIPDSCQWALFLRSHDELTLETVSSSDRDFLWDAYAADRRARINLGIRRRLAPLVQGDRRRIELLNSLMLSMPGTPIIYYGDEIAMGDNIHLGDRDSVRTPMQWSPDRNGGFSGADPPDLILPTNMDSIYGYETVNVEAQLRDRYSILNWMRRMLAVRRRHAAFGRGALKLLFPKNRKVLAYLRQHEGDTLLCVANLAPSSQAVELDLSQFVGRVPVELHAGVLFPPIGELTYLLTLPPYGFYWFSLTTTADPPAWHTPAPEPLPEFITIVIRRSLASEAFEIANKLTEHEALQQYIAKRRWFNLKGQEVQFARVVIDIGDVEHESVLTTVEVKTPNETSRWLLPLGILWEDEPSAPVLANRLAMARVRRHRRVGLITDAFALPAFVKRLMANLADAKEISLNGGLIRFQPTEIGRTKLWELSNREIQWIAAEHSNSCLTIGDAAAVKLYRRVSTGTHPEAEMNRYLTNQGFSNAPSLLGDVVHVAGDGTCSTIAIVAEFIRNEGDAWVWILDHITRLLDAHVPAAAMVASREDLLTDCNAICRAIGRRLGEMHSVLKRRSSDIAFEPQSAASSDVAKWASTIKQRIEKAFKSLSHLQTWTRDQDRESAQHLLREREKIVSAVDVLAEAGEGTPITRIHGDFHLGQVLVSSGDAYIIDFEGEPGTATAERRAKTSPLRDVAGLLRSIDYAGASLIDREAIGTVPVDDAQRDELMSQFRARASQEFLSAYWETSGAQPDTPTKCLLGLFLIEKAVYEIAYEAANRPTWIGVPVAGLLRILQRMENEWIREVKASPIDGLA
jgi:maltose alpha-D-glucosyltransferase / alpha-amylase